MRQFEELQFEKTIFIDSILTIEKNTFSEAWIKALNFSEEDLEENLAVDRYKPVEKDWNVLLIKFMIKIAVSKGCKGIIISYPNLPWKFIRFILRKIVKRNKIELLKFDHQPSINYLLSEKDPDSVYKHLKNNTSLRELTFSNCKINYDSLVRITKVIIGGKVSHSKKKIKCLNISSNSLPINIRFVPDLIAMPEFIDMVVDDSTRLNFTGGDIESIIEEAKAANKPQPILLNHQDIKSYMNSSRNELQFMK